MSGDKADTAEPRAEVGRMRELLGRVDGIDSDLNETLRIITQFDGLIRRRVGISALMRAAANLTGCAVGAVYPAHRLVRRVDSRGTPITQMPSAEELALWTRRPLGDLDGGVVWVERNTETNINDETVLDRLASSIQITIDRTMGTVPDHAGALEALLDREAALGTKLAIARRLGLEAGSKIYLIVMPVISTDPPPTGVTHIDAVVGTRFGGVRAIVAGADCPQPVTGTCGIGETVTVERLADSFDQALVALRLSRAGEAVTYRDLGALSLLVRAHDASPVPHPDAIAIGTATASSTIARRVLEAMELNTTVRAAAHELGLHHSTVQAHCDRLEKELGYSFRTAQGRTRLALGLALHRLGRDVFDVETSPDGSERRGRSDDV